MVCLNSYAFYALDTFILRVSINLCHNNDIIPTPLGAVCYHLLKGKTVIVCSRHRAVDISIKYDYAFILCVFFADTQLSFDRLFGLIVARISCVNNCCFHNSFSFDFSDLSFDGRNGNGNVGNMTPCCNGTCRQGLRAIHLALDGKAFPFILPVRKTSYANCSCGAGVLFRGLLCPRSAPRPNTRSRRKEAAFCPLVQSCKSRLSP